MNSMDEKTAERFWANVDKRGPDECWEWKGARSRFGYGYFHAPCIRQTLAHRAAYIIHNGPFPSLAAGRCVVMHKCDNPPCVNPAHLSVGTHLDNVQDMIKKSRGRYSYGSAHHSAKLTELDAECIRRCYATRVFSMALLAKSFGVSLGVVQNILSGRAWVPGHRPNRKSDTRKSFVTYD